MPCPKCGDKQAYMHTEGGKIYSCGFSPATHDRLEKACSGEGHNARFIRRVFGALLHNHRVICTCTTLLDGCKCGAFQYQQALKQQKE
jgi:hypothetical protein